MRPLRSVRTLLALVLPLAACELAELPPSAETRAPRDTAEDSADTTSPEGDADAAPGDVFADAADVFADAADVFADVADGTTEADGADAAEPDAGPEVVEVDDTSDVEDGDSGDASEGDASDVEEADASDADASDVVDPDATDTTDATDDGADLADTDPADSTDVVVNCNTVAATHVVAASPHIATCSPTSYETTPPTSGPHYPIWAAFKTYSVPVNPGFLVHSMEHGAVVIHYRCDVACDAEVAALQSFLDARPADPLCVAPLRNRFIVAPRPDLDVRFAAAAWGASLRSDCFDLEALGAFLDAHYAMAPENFCADGVDIEAIAPGSASYCPP